MIWVFLIITISSTVFSYRKWRFLICRSKKEGGEENNSHKKGSGELLTSTITDFGVKVLAVQGEPKKLDEFIGYLK